MLPRTASTIPFSMLHIRNLETMRVMKGLFADVRAGRIAREALDNAANAYIDNPDNCPELKAAILFVADDLSRRSSAAEAPAID